MKKIINEQFKRMQRLAGLITESQLNENLKFKDVDKDIYTATSDFSIFKKGDKVRVIKIKNEGQEVTLWLSKDNDTFTSTKSNMDSIKGDLEDSVEVFD